MDESFFQRPTTITQLQHIASMERGSLSSRETVLFFSIKGASITYNKYYTRPLHNKMHTAAHTQEYQRIHAQKQKSLDNLKEDINTGESLRPRRLNPKITPPSMLGKNILRHILQSWRYLHKEVSTLCTLKHRPRTEQSGGSEDNLQTRRVNIMENLVIST
jgi:hypothetical protein